MDWIEGAAENLGFLRKFKTAGMLDVYQIGTGTGAANPTAGLVKFNVGETTIRFNDTNAVGVDVSAFILDQVAVGTRIVMRALSSNYFVEFTVSSITGADQSGYIIFTGSVTGGTSVTTGGTWTNLELVGVSFQTAGASGSITEAAVLAAGNFIRLNASGQLLDNTGTVISGTTVVPLWGDLPAASTHKDDVVKVLGHGNRGIFVTSDATDWTPVNGVAVLYRKPTVRTFTGPAVAVSAVANSGGKVRCTATAHLLTSASNNRYVHISGWTGDGIAGQYRITWVDANTFDLPDVPYVDATHPGIPTVARANNTDKITVASITNPPLTVDSTLITDFSMQASGTGSKSAVVNFGGTDIYSRSLTTDVLVSTEVRTANQAAKSPQKSGFNINGATGRGTSSTAPVSTTVDTSVATTTLIQALLAVPDESITFTDVRHRWEC